jgi:hypothetical protein
MIFTNMARTTDGMVSSSLMANSSQPLADITCILVRALTTEGIKLKRV